MIHMPLPTQSNRNLPRRIDSLKATQSPYFIELDDELRDIRRVYTQGQEEDLRHALSRTINRVEELTSMLKEACKAQADLQTELTLAKSNLQMALANNEMLEDALKRDPGHSKDVGWRRMSTREQNLKAGVEAERRRSTDSLTSTEHSASPTLSQPSPHPDYSPIVPRSATIPSPAPSTESRFFRFRLGNGVSSSSHPSSPRLSAGQSPIMSVSHLTSASLPSLVPARNVDKEIEDLQHRLESERKAHKAACDAKVALESELESLSQALFEEANKMVATERMKLAETEEALREAREQGEALKNVLRLFERDSATAPTPTHVFEPETGNMAEPSRSRDGASSSAVGIQSPSSGVPSLCSRPSSPALPSKEVPSSSKTISAVVPPMTTGGQDEQSAESLAGVVHSQSENGLVLDVRIEKPPPPPPTSPTPPHQANLHVSPALSDPPSPPLSPVPSPLSAPGEFLFTPPRAVNYYDGEESPWADATSAASPGPKVVT